MSTQAPEAPPAGPAPLPKVSAGPARTKIGGGERRQAAAATARLMLRGGLLGYAAILIGWGITEAAGIADARSTWPVAVYTAVLAGVYAVTVSAASDLREGIFGRAIVRGAVGLAVGVALGAAAGVVSSQLFSALQQTEDPTVARFYILRMLAWGAFGVGIGLVGGVAERSSRKAVNGLFGGLLGGAIGGLLFHWVGLRVDEPSSARLVGLALVGTSVGAAIGLVEGARRHAWVRVIAGGLAGKEFILYHDVTSIGSAPKCQITLIKDPKAKPFHAQIAIEGGRRMLTPLEGHEVLVNGAPVRQRALRAGDQIQIGGTTLLYQDRD